MTLALGLRKILHILIESTENMSKYSDAKELASLTLGKKPSMPTSMTQAYCNLCHAA